ncbi:SbcC/MukB-like Walker B domain-containing protein [Algoriphagus jejuensis]|uniref:SbcC/MukB-like Walker B domain-containing protein n=1 Tax=Algoriphagus jejuensis TaxID=419934 RepID=A0ABP3YA82_9BACT
MIPVRLDIQGLYSYREKQTIDFTQLTGAGLFGIFGAVGSGKSSILEAVLLALYGSTERLSDRGEKNSMLNLQSDHLLLNFEFNAGQNNAKTYLARYSAKRNPKNFEEVKPAEHVFYEKIDGDWVPVTASGEHLVGMKKEHFKQTVIIPQGKFREFIDLTPGPRAEMMKELFGLERFDLSRKTGSLLKVVREEKIRLDTQISALEHLTQEILSEREMRLTELQKQSVEVSQKLQVAELELRRKEAQQAKYRQLLKFREEKTELLALKPEIETRRQLHSEFITAKTHLRPVWDQLSETKADLEKYTVSVTDCERFKIEFAREVALLEKEEIELKQKNQERSARESKIRDLKKVIEIQLLNQNLAQATAALETLRPEIDTRKHALNSLETTINEVEKRADGMDATDSSQLAQWMSDAKDWANWLEQLAKLEQEIAQTWTETSQISNALSEIDAQVPAGEKTLESWITNQKHRLHKLETERDSLIRKQGLAAHVHLLHAGESCPLCGAVDHPNPLEAEAEALQLQEKTAQIRAAKEQIDQGAELLQKHAELSFHQASFKKSIAVQETEKAELSTKLTDLKQALEDAQIKSLDDLTQKIQIMQRNSQQKVSLALEVKKLRQQWQSERILLEKSEKDYQNLQLKHQSLLSNSSSKKEEIKDMAFCRQFFDKDSDSIRATIAKVEKNIEEAIQLLEGKQKHLREKRGEQVKNLADLEIFEKLKAQNASKLEKLNADFESLKSHHGFLDEARLIRLFQHSLDAEKVLREITDFDQKLAIAENRTAELENEEGISDFREELFQELFAQFQALKSAMESSQNEVLLLDREIQELKKKLLEKTSLQTSLAKLDTRLSYLAELERLFKGSGFVKYVSSIYLKELCNTANLRFMTLTKNSLSLEIDDNNTFWVIDYLNGAKRRLLKTLSGGQTFQASLCLALALAEKVKSLNQADQSFFFLDEGFGALDRNALRVVFETLKSLRHENRIVGIISHVEELQQEVGVFAQVELDPEKGSKVSYSY